jgi:hypothetical protein
MKDGGISKYNRRRNIKEEKKMYTIKNLQINNAGPVMNMVI